MSDFTESVSKCAICKVLVKPEEKSAICTNCDQQFHFNHLQVWLRKQSKCPNCKQIFSFEFMRAMRPVGNPAVKPKRKNPTKPNHPHSSSTRNYQNPRSRSSQLEQEEYNPTDIGAKIGGIIVLLFLFILVVGAA